MGMTEGHKYQELEIIEGYLIGWLPYSHTILNEILSYLKPTFVTWAFVF